MTVQRVLVAFDFSEPAQRALRSAGELARACGAKLDVVHVHPDIYDGRSTPELGLPWPSQGQEERYLRFLEQELKTAVMSTLGADGESATLHVVRGDQVKRILALVEQVGADLVCVGATGKGRVQRVLLGSVSESLLRSSAVPVLVVH
jgi:nucleotide-binding universal stress UspA family protein